jgi:hypothetical protein
LKKQPGEKEILPGGIYIHQGDSEHRYQVLKTGILDATGYETTGKVRKLVKYRQLYPGAFPEGTDWLREENDFLGNTIDEAGNELPNFTFVEMGELPENS